MDRIYGEEEAKLLERAGHGPDLAGAALLGKDAATLCSPGTAGLVRSILANTEPMLDSLLRVQNQLANEGGGQRMRAFIDSYCDGFLRRMGVSAAATMVVCRAAASGASTARRALQSKPSTRSYRLFPPFCLAAGAR